MIIYNPTDAEVTIVIAGKPLAVQPTSSIEVTKEEAEYWKQIHGFMQIVSGKTKEPEQVQEVIQEPKADPVVVEKPKSKKK